LFHIFTLSAKSVDRKIHALLKDHQKELKGDCSNARIMVEVCFTKGRD
jgi:hypothetical protein